MTRLYFVGVVILLLILLVASIEKPEDHVLGSATAEVEWSKGIADNDDIYPPPRDLFSGCDCQLGHWGRELIATVCHAERIDGPWVRGCYYVRGQSIYWANEKRDESPL